MMEAKDTVMSDEQLARIWAEEARPLGKSDKLIAKAQAELSFKAGIEEGARLTVDDTLDVGKQLGRVEVVEFVNKPSMDARTLIFQVSEEGWKAKLRDWGIKEE